MLGLFSKTTPNNNNYEEGIIMEIVYPNRQWRVSFAATYWFAQSEHPLFLKPGDFVRVVGRANATTLLIESV